MADPAARNGPTAIDSAADRQPEHIPLPCTQGENQSSDLTWVKDAFAIPSKDEFMWQPISTAPFDRDLELAVIDRDGPHALVFPCKRVLTGWIKSATKERVDISPSHWRIWEPANNEF